jgi:3-oxoacyl-[acyl-carrier protein] reductase
MGERARVALLTGASSGIGFSVARLLAQQGYDLVVGSRNPLQAADELRASSGRNVLAVRADLSDSRATDDLVEAARSLGGADALFLNHGGPPVRSFLEVTEEEWNAYFQLMVQGPLRLLRQVIPDFERRGGGRVVAISSFTVKAPHPGIILSNSLRSALVNALKTAAQELGPKGILINCVAPGYIATQRMLEWNEQQARRHGVSPEDMAQANTASIPLGRYGSPQQVAELVAFLLSPRNGYITGQQILADGGLITAN